MNFVRRLMADRSGTTAIEYGLIAMLIGLVLVVAAPTLRGAVTSMYDIISAAVAEALGRD